MAQVGAKAAAGGGGAAAGGKSPAAEKEATAKPPADGRRTGESPARRAAAAKVAKAKPQPVADGRRTSESPVAAKAAKGEPTAGANGRHKGGGSPAAAAGKQPAPDPKALDRWRRERDNLEHVANWLKYYRELIVLYYVDPLEEQFSQKRLVDKEMKRDAPTLQLQRADGQQHDERPGRTDILTRGMEPCTLMHLAACGRLNDWLDQLDRYLNTVHADMLDFMKKTDEKYAGNVRFRDLKQLFHLLAAIGDVWSLPPVYETKKADDGDEAAGKRDKPDEKPFTRVTGLVVLDPRRAELDAECKRNRLPIRTIMARVNHSVTLFRALMQHSQSWVENVPENLAQGGALLGCPARIRKIDAELPPYFRTPVATDAGCQPKVCDGTLKLLCEHSAAGVPLPDDAEPAAASAAAVRTSPVATARSPSPTETRGKESKAADGDKSKQVAAAGSQSAVTAGRSVTATGASGSTLASSVVGSMQGTPTKTASSGTGAGKPTQHSTPLVASGGGAASQVRDTPPSAKTDSSQQPLLTPSRAADNKERPLPSRSSASTTADSKHKPAKKPKKAKKTGAVKRL